MVGNDEMKCGGSLVASPLVFWLRWSAETLPSEREGGEGGGLSRRRVPNIGVGVTFVLIDPFRATVMKISQLAMVQPHQIENGGM